MMVINLSEKTVNTVHIALTDVKRSLMKQLKNVEGDEDKKSVLNGQLDDVEDALTVFNELMEEAEEGKQKNGLFSNKN